MPTISAFLGVAYSKPEYSPYSGRSLSVAYSPIAAI